MTRFVVIAEWVDGNARYLVKQPFSGSGDRLAPWDYKGLLHEALYGEW